jgi:hypothetical protein
VTRRSREGREGRVDARTRLAELGKSGKSSRGTSRVAAVFVERDAGRTHWMLMMMLMREEETGVVERRIVTKRIQIALRREFRVSSSSPSSSSSLSRPSTHARTHTHRRTHMHRGRGVGGRRGGRKKMDGQVHPCKSMNADRSTQRLANSFGEHVLVHRVESMLKPRAVRSLALSLYLSLSFSLSL